MKAVKTKGTEPMQNLRVGVTASVPLPSSKQKRLVQGEVDLKLFSAVHREMTRHKPKIKICQVLEWGLQQYLARTNPEAAKTLGIVPEEK